MSNNNVPIRLVIQEPNTPAREMLFEDSSVLKIGRGARKGIDVPLEDPSIGRVHAAINIRKEGDISVMDMGSAATSVNGKSVGSRGKLSNGDLLQVGQTRITVYIGAEALKSNAERAGSAASNSSGFLAQAAEVDDALVALDANLSGLPDFSLDGTELPGNPTGQHDVLEIDDDAILESTNEHAHLVSDAPTTASPAFSASPTSASPAYSTTPTSASPAYAASSSPDHAAAAAASTPSAPSSVPDNAPSNPFGQGLFPGHYEPHETYGVLGPAPTPFPEHFPAPSLDLLLDVAQRINQEIWAVYPNVF